HKCRWPPLRNRPFKAFQAPLGLYLKSDLSIGLLEDNRGRRVHQVIIPHQIPDATESSRRRGKYIMDDAELSGVCLLPEIEPKPIVIDKLCCPVEKCDPIKLGLNRPVSWMHCLRQPLCITIRLSSLGIRHFARSDSYRHGVDILESGCAPFHELSPGNMCCIAITRTLTNSNIAPGRTGTL